MNKVVFDCNNTKVVIQCNKDDKMKDIIAKYLSKSDKNKNNLTFLYNGQLLNEELSFNKCANSLDRQRNSINILVCGLQDLNDNLVKSKYVICPKCYDSALLSIKDFKISITGCKSGHRTEDLDLNEFNEAQNIDESTIKCDKCEKAKNETQQKKLFTCNMCKQNLCSICKNSHDESHNNYVKDYDENQFICKQHFENYTNYCTNCKKDICTLCVNEHKDHKFITYDSIMVDFDKIKSKELEDTKEKIIQLKSIVTGMIAQLNNLNRNLNCYFDIYDNIIYNFNSKKRNYSVLQNVNNLKKFNDDLLINITEIIKDNNIKTKFTNIIYLQTKIDFKKLKKSNQNFQNKNVETNTNEIIIDTINTNNKNEIITDIKNKINTDNNNNEDKGINENSKKNDNYENFNVSKIKELQSFATKNTVSYLGILNDGRIMTYQTYYGEDNTYYKLCVYSEKNRFICDINIDFESVISFDIMHDGYVIINTYEDEVKAIEIKKDKIEEIWKFDKKSKYIITISKNIFLINVIKKNVNAGFFSDVGITEYELYTYDKGKLIFYKNIHNIYKERSSRKDKGDYSKNICHINGNEFVLYVCKKGKIYGSNEYLIFYNMQNDQEIKQLKVGKGENGDNMTLINKENLIVEGEKTIILIDVKNRTIKKELKLDINFSDLIILNEKSFLSYRLLSHFEGNGYLEQYELEDPDTIVLKEKKEFDELDKDLMSKYPGNKLIIYDNKKIIIYG